MSDHEVQTVVDEFFDSLLADQMMIAAISAGIRRLRNDFARAGVSEENNENRVWLSAVPPEQDLFAAQMTMAEVMRATSVDGEFLQRVGQQWIVAVHTRWELGFDRVSPAQQACQVKALPLHCWATFATSEMMLCITTALHLGETQVSRSL